MGTLKREKLGRCGEYTDLHAAQLLSGFDFLSSAYGEGVLFDGETARRDWAEHGPAILAEWLGVLDGKEPLPDFGHVQRPESLRPWGFWAFDVGERPDLGDELAVLSDNGLLLPGDEARWEKLKREREAQRKYSEEFEAARHGRKG